MEMTREHKRPWQLVVVAVLFILAGIFGIYVQMQLNQAAQPQYRLDILFLPIGIGLLLRWQVCHTLAQIALIMSYALLVIVFLGIPLGFAHIEYDTIPGPRWLQLMIILVLALITTSIVHWMLRVIRRPDVRSWFEKTDGRAVETNVAAADKG